MLTCSPVSWKSFLSSFRIDEQPGVMTLHQQDLAAVQLDDVAEVLRLYGKALSGREMLLTSVGAGGQRGMGWAAPDHDGSAFHVVLPARMAQFPSERENFNWYKVLITHQAGHIEFGSPEPSEVAPFLDSFADVQLASAIYEVVEDMRIDVRVVEAYPGARKLFAPIFRHALASRPSLAGRSLRHGFLEGLVQYSLGSDAAASAPGVIKPHLQEGAQILRNVAMGRAGAEDVRRAVERLYVLAASLPSDAAEEDDDCHEDDVSHAVGEGEFFPQQLESAAEPDHMPLQLPQQVDFRPSRYLLPPEEASCPDPLSEVQHGTEVSLEQPLLHTGHGTFLYPEWDFRARGYRENWCRAIEGVLEEGTSDFYVRALTEYRPLVHEVRNRFANLFPELFRRVPRRFDGEDFDLDSVIEFVVDEKAGQTPSEKLYWRRERTQRNVAVALLVDMSATTSETILLEQATSTIPDLASAEDYAAHLARLTAGVDHFGRPVRKQAIDVAKEAAIVLMQAFETIGDDYAVYAFSGSGRENVRFGVVKDFAEQMDQRVARRIDSVQPDCATRMGTAIRHTARRLARVEAQTRLLILLSDGRPYDRDYGSGPDDLDYAVGDTRQSLLEALKQGIRPCCLTVDKTGSDYLRQMCEDIPYEIVEQVRDLPLKLLAMYPRLTA